MSLRENVHVTSSPSREVVDIVDDDYWNLDGATGVSNIVLAGAKLSSKATSKNCGAQDPHDPENVAEALE